MSLASGTKLGPYEISSALGAGGMGEVYRARDTKLNRDVAIKVLLPAVASDPDRLGRFSREAQVLASLNHPNIAAIYGIEESSGVTALVMELVEGEDLSQRISRGPISIDDALPIARQIAEALEAAHDHGIIHRDLKPANIKLRSDGTVKVLDFGLAKAIDPTAGSSVAAMNSPTLSLHATQAGIILGTAAYMSPEQARGQAVDRRADIWAFGCVLFEILTGTSAFKGENATDIITSVVRDTPDWNALPQTPLAIRRLLQRCLEKDARRRVAHMSIARLEIDEATMSTAPLLGVVADTAPSSRSRRGVLMVSACALAALAIGWATARYFSSPIPPAAAVQFQLLPPDQIEFNRRGFATFAVSPDGRYVAYAAMNGKGLMNLWLHSFGDGAARELPNTTAATNPFWSPDGHFIAFHADRKLQRLEIASGTTQLICECAPNGGTWSRDNVILFSATTSLQRVTAAGGTPEILMTLNSAENEVRFQRPSFLPDGRHFVFTVMRADNATPVLRFGELGSAESKVLGNIVSTPEFVEPGFLVYGDNGRLMARSFDAVSGTWTGDPIVISNSVRQAPLGEAVAFSTSSGGTLVYDPRSLTAEADLVWVDRAGREGGTFANVNGFHTFALAPNDQVAAVELLVSGRSAIWLLDGARGTRTRLTFEPTPAQGHPMWSPDMSQILYFSGTPGAGTTLMLKAVANTGHPVALLSSPANNAQPTDWSRDGRYVLFDETDPKTSSDVRYVALGGDNKPITFVGTPFQEHLGRLSPDGKYLAYTSNDSGRPEVFVVTFPAATRRWSISSSGGTAPTWRQDGKELFFVDDRDVLMAVAVTRAPEFQPSVPTPLFPLRSAPSDGLNYAVARDGRVLVARPSNRATVGPLQVVMHLPQLLGGRE